MPQAGKPCAAATGTTSARACLAHWAAHDLPLVVTRQHGADAWSSDLLALGLPAPGRWDRRRIALQVPRRELLRVAEFPRAEAIAHQLPEAAKAPWRLLCDRLAALGAPAHVYGSHGWQLISGLDHLRASSDIDLWVAVCSAEQADAVAAALQCFSGAACRLDGELVFEGQRAAAWREWVTWRTGATSALLLKGLSGALLARGLDQVCGPALVAVAAP